MKNALTKIMTVVVIAMGLSSCAAHRGSFDAGGASSAVVDSSNKDSSHEEDGIFFPKSSRKERNRGMAGTRL